MKTTTAILIISLTTLFVIPGAYLIHESIVAPPPPPPPCGDTVNRFATTDANSAILCPPSTMVEKADDDTFVCRCVPTP